MVGGSFIAMETAAALRRRGLEVTVVVRDEAPFARTLGAEVGAVVRARHEEQGVRFAVRRGVVGIHGTDAVQAVELDGGERLDADLVVVGIGVEPVTGFVDGVPLARDGGLVVDEEFRVAPGVWAAGDVARYREPYTGREVRIEHWRVAEQQGRAAARSMADRGEPFAGVPFFWTQHFDLELGYAGAAPGWDELVMTGDPAEVRVHGLLRGRRRAAGRLRHAARRARRLRRADAPRQPAAGQGVARPQAGRATDGPALRDRLRGRHPRGAAMPERTIHANEAEFPWESEAPDPDAPDALRWRTLVSADRTETSGVSMGTFEVPPGAELEPHTHHPQEVYYVTAGEAEVFHDGEWWRLRAGDVVYHPADAVHGVRNRGTERVVIVWIFPADSYDEIEYFDAPA